MGANLYNELFSNNLGKTCLITTDKKVSYTEFFDLIDQLAQKLILAGVVTGQRVGIQLLRPEELLISYYACFKIGAKPVPIPFVDKERIDGAIVSASISHLIRGLDQVVELDQNKTDTFKEEEAIVIFTSGTTSNKLKGVRLSHDGISGTCRFMNSAMAIDNQTIECVYASLDHAFGFGRCHSILSVGGSVVLLPLSKGLSQLMEIIEDNNCNALSTPPSVLASLIRVSKTAVKNLASNIKYIQTGAMRFDAAYRSALIDLLPDARIFLHYGLSEAMRVTFYEINKWTNKLHTEGPASKGVDLAILDNDLQLLPSSTEGKIALKGRNLCLGYLDQKLWDDQQMNGWFVTSDIGMLDEDGFLVFKGRSDDTINCNGALVHPDEIESKLKGLLKDYKFCVLGVKDPKAIKDTIVALCFEKEIKVSKEAITSFLSDTDRLLIPQLVASVEEFPMTRSGKVNRNQLRKLISEK